MAGIVIKDGIQHRRGTAEALRRHNPIPKSGEIMVEIDTGQAKLGNGVKPWNELPYIGANESEIEAVVRSYISNLSDSESLIWGIDGGEIRVNTPEEETDFYDGGEITGV